MITPGVWRSILLMKANKSITRLTPVSLYLWQNVSFKFSNNYVQSKQFSTSGCCCNKPMIPLRSETRPMKPTRIRKVVEVAKIMIQSVRLKFEPRPELSKKEVLEAAYITYEDVLEAIPVQQFLIEFNMPDTFASWFTVVELHLWLISARLMKEDALGYYARDMLTEAFFKDVGYRATLLGPRATLYRQKQIAILGYQFTAAYYGYDEGVQSSDKVLAAMVWRRFFGFECDDAEQIERIVKYIRVQLNHLCFLSFHDIMFKRENLIIPLSEVQIN